MICAEKNGVGCGVMCAVFVVECIFDLIGACNCQGTETIG